MTRNRRLHPRYAEPGIHPVSRRTLRDLWRATARVRRAAGDTEGAARAARNARLADSPLRDRRGRKWYS